MTGIGNGSDVHWTKNSYDSTAYPVLEYRTARVLGGKRKSNTERRVYKKG